MTQARRGRGRRDRSGAGIPQLPWQQVRNPYPPMALLDEERMDALHATSIRILSELGIRVMGDNVIGLFERAGAIVDRESRIVRIDEELVTEALRTAPREFTLMSRNPDKQLALGGDHLVSSGAPVLGRSCG